MRAERWAARGIKAALGVGGERVALRGRARWAAAREGWGRVRARPCQRLCGGASTEAIVGTLYSPQYVPRNVSLWLPEERRREAHLAAEVCGAGFTASGAHRSIEKLIGAVSGHSASFKGPPRRICARAAREQLSPTRARAPENSRAAEQVFHEQRVAARAEAQKKRAGWPRRRGCVARR